VRERTIALIHIAHPKFREALMNQARERHYVYPDQLVSLDVGAPELEAMESTFTMQDGSELRVRPINPADEDMIRDLVYSYSPETILHRFFHQVPAMPHSDLQKLIEVDYRRDIILVAIENIGRDVQRIVAVGRYHINPATGAAEVAFSMREAFQGKGLGTYLFQRIIEIARNRGVATFYAEIMADNTAMVRLFHKCAIGPIQSTLNDGVYELKFTLPPHILIETQTESSNEF